MRWIETRTESLQTTTHGRGQMFDLELAAKRDGSLLALKVTQYLDAGAYVGTFGAFQACACLLAGGAYKWPGGIAARTIGVLTNRVPTDPYRGAGRPEATHNIERMIDMLAQEIGMDPAEHPPEELHPARRVPVHQQLRPDVRLGQLRGRARQGARSWSATTTSASEQAEAPQAGPLSGHRPLDLDRDLRLRPERGHRAARPAAWR